MRLTKKNITYYLLNKGFLNPDAFITGDYTLTQTMSRNSIFKVQHQNSTGLFVKQLLTQDQTNSYLMQKDATSHYLIHHSTIYEKISGHIPKYFGYDPTHNILITEYFKETKSVHELVFEKKEFSEVHAKQMASILASFHFDITKEVKDNTSLQFFNAQIPWILNLGNLHNSNSEKIENSVLLEIHKHPELVKKIDKVASKWETYSLIHGDIKWLNFIVLPHEEELKLVDWEIADLGDPLWDVAGVFQSYLTSWVLSFDNQNVQQHQKVKDTDFITLENILPVIKIFWDEYAKLQKFTPEDYKMKLTTTLSYMAVRMIQTAFENNMSQPKIYPNSVRIIQFCDHILNDTEALARQWNFIN